MPGKIANERRSVSVAGQKGINPAGSGFFYNPSGPAKAMVKQAIKTAFILVLLITFPSPALAGQATAMAHLLAGAGYGGSTDSWNVSGEFGGTTKNLDNNIIYGLGAAAIFSGDDLPSGMREWDYQGTDYTSCGTYRKGNSFGVHVKLGAEPVPETGFFLFAIGGVRCTEKIELVMQKETNIYYENDPVNRWDGVLGAGAGWFPERPLPSVQVSWDNARGISFLAGISW